MIFIGALSGKSDVGSLLFPAGLVMKFGFEQIVPTLTQWGLFILILSFLIIGAIGIKMRFRKAMSQDLVKT